MGRVPGEAAVDVDGESGGEINGGHTETRRERLECPVPYFARRCHSILLCRVISHTLSLSLSTLRNYSPQVPPVTALDFTNVQFEFTLQLHRGFMKHFDNYLPIRGTNKIFTQFLSLLLRIRYIN